MFKAFWQPFKSEKKKQQRDKKIYEKVGRIAIVRSDSETESGSADYIKEVSFKKNDNPSKHSSSCKSPKRPLLTSTPKVHKQTSHGQLDTLKKTPTDVIKKYMFQRQLSCPEQQKPNSSLALPIPEVRRQHSFHEMQESVMTARSKVQNQKQIVINTEDTGDCHCKIDFPNDQDIKVSCKIVSKPTSPAINTYENIFPEELNNNDPVNNTRLLQLKIDNIRNIPPSGKIGISVKLPTSILQHVQVGPSTSTVVEVRTRCPIGNDIWITENVNVSKTSRPYLEIPRISPPMDYLKVDEGFRPRSNSDSKLKNNRPKQGSRCSSRQLLPGIMVEDFSSRKAELQKKLEGESSDLRLDLCDDEEFFSMLNGRRRRSFTYPEDVLSRPNSAELHQEEGGTYMVKDNKVLR